MRVHGIILCLACVCEIVLAVPFAGFDVDIEGLSFKPIDSRDGKKQHVVQPLKSHEKSSKRSIKTKGAKKPSHPSSVKKADPKPITVIKSSVKSTTKTTKTVQKGSPMKTTRTSTFTLNLATKTLAPDGVPKVMMVANNQLDYPISVTTGDIVVVVVKNNMKAPTSIHWHGLFQVASPWMDGAGMVTQCLIQPKTSMTYKFSTENQTGTFWWHAHYSSQYVDGLRGPFIIHDPADPYKSLYDEEIIVTLSDHFHMPAMNVAKTYYFAYDPVPDSGLINGRGRYDCSSLLPAKKCTPNAPLTVFNVEPGRRYRLRFINMGAQAMFQVSIDGHNMTVIEADGIYTNPTEVSSFPITSSQRYSVIVTANADYDNYWFRATIFDMYTPTGSIVTNSSNFDTVAIWRYRFADTTLMPTSNFSDNIPLNVYNLGELNGMTVSAMPQYTQSVYFDFTLAYDLVTNISFATVSILSDTTNIFGQEYVMPSVPTLKTLLDNATFPVTSNVYDTEGNNWVFLSVRNSDNIEHTFHLHGHTFYVLTSGHLLHSLSTTKTFARRDAIQVPACTGGTGGSGESGCTKGYVNLLINFNHPGAWVFHCHLEWHMAVGLMMTFVNTEGLDEVRSSIPATFWRTC